MFARTLYVKPSSEVVVRTGQGNDYKIVAMVKDGASVEFIEEGDDYTKIRLANGKEGWLLKRFLSNEPPLGEIVASLRAEKKEMKQRQTELVRKLEEVTSTLSRTEAERDSVLTERDQIRTSFRTLQQDTSDVVKIKNDRLKTAKENELLLQKLAAVEQENKSLQKDDAIKWFLAGGGVLLLGMLLGMMFGKSRKKKSTLL
ncbi:MAG: TIGR04211 family SH3 domain-containing protein [Desulfobulbaceae bacterium]|nr:TIGR04211 family SH3 domain-containing protein [Desulfobulbaceae bacterium]